MPPSVLLAAIVVIVHAACLLLSMVPTHICTTHYKNNADMSGLLETGHMWTCQCVGTRDSETKIRYELQGYAKTLTERGHIGNSL